MLAACATSHQHEAPAEQAQAPAPVAEPVAGAGYSWLALPTGAKATSALLIERTAPSQVAVNAPYTYEIKATNLTDMPLNEVVVTNTADPNFKFESSDPAPTSNAGGKQVWNLGTLGPRESKTITVKGQATKAVAIKDCLEATYNTKLCNEVAVVEPAITMTAQAPAQVLSCDPIPVTYVVTNTGTGVARNVKLDAPITGGTTQDGASALSIAVGDLGPGESRTVNTTLKPSAKGNVGSAATAVGEGNLKVTSSTTTKVVKPTLTITKTGTDTTLLGRELAYVLKVTNTGDGEARDLVIEDSVPAGATLKAASDNGAASADKVLWNIGTLAPGASKEVTVSYNAPRIAKYESTAIARAYCADAVTAVKASEVRGIPAILLEVIDEVDPVLIGETTVYAIGATNQGSAVGTNIKIVVTLEPTMEFVSAEGVTNATVAGNTVTFAPLKELPAGEKAVWRVTVRAKNPGDVRLKVVMNSDQITRTVEETESTTFYK
jgi:uncharacterized repeat protein (TIGR01451 family)